MDIIEILSRLPYMTRIEEGKYRHCYAWDCDSQALWYFKKGAKTKRFPTGQQDSATYCSFHALKITSKTKYECWRFEKAMIKWEAEHQLETKEQDNGPSA